MIYKLNDWKINTRTWTCVPTAQTRHKNYIRGMVHMGIVRELINTRVRELQFGTRTD